MGYIAVAAVSAAVVWCVAWWRYRRPIRRQLTDAHNRGARKGARKGYTQALRDFRLTPGAHIIARRWQKLGLTELWAELVAKATHHTTPDASEVSFAASPWGRLSADERGRIEQAERRPARV